MNWLQKLGWLVLVSSVGCAGGETTTDAEQAGVVACDPFASHGVSVELAEVLVVGRSSDGTLYVIDRVELGMRLFISDADELVLERESGSGETNTGDGRLLSFSFFDREPELHVELWQGQDGTQRMGVLQGELPPGDKQFEIGEAGEELELLAADEVTGLKLRSQQIEAVVEYAATVAESRLLVVVRPEPLLSYDDFRVFFGPLERLQERKLGFVGRARDGGSTRIEFDVEGELAQVSFPVVFENETFQPGPPSLTLDQAEVGIELLSEGAAPEGSAYYCAK